MHPYTITLANPAPDLATHGPYIVSLLTVIFAVDCDISPSLPPSEFSKQSLLLPVDIVLPLVFAHRCCFKQPSALDAPINGWLLCHMSYHACWVVCPTHMTASTVVRLSMSLNPCNYFLIKNDHMNNGEKAPPKQRRVNDNISKR